MQTYVRFGLLTGAALILWGLIGFFTGIEYNHWSQWLNRLIMFGGVCYGIYEAREKDHEGYITFGQGFGTGFRIALLAGAVGLVFFVIYVQFINTGFTQHIREMGLADMEAKGMNNEQIEKASGTLDFFTSLPMMLVFGAVGIAVGGAIESLIGAAIFQKKRPEQPLAAAE